nr:head fiber protein [uncultured Bacteroides sp.]
MSAGFTYNLTPEPSVEERYDVQSGVRRRGAYKLDTTNLNVGDYLPSFTPIAANLKTKVCVPVRNVKVIEAYATGAEALAIKIAKNSLAYAGMFIGNGSKGAQVSAIDKSNAGYDVLTIAAAFGANIAKDAVLFEAAAVSGTTPKNVANSALFERKKIESGINLIALLMRAFEIEPDKLVIPFSDKDKANLPHFQFNE